METLTDEQLDDISCRLVAALRPDRVYLFGSHAGGEPHADSDIDILIVVPDSDQSRSDLYAAAERCLRGTRLPVELVIYTTAQFEQQKRLVSSLPYVISRKGRLLYAA